jgi:hypothetical protein
VLAFEEKFVPRGGRMVAMAEMEGVAVFVADRSVQTLKELGRRRIYRAEAGRPERRGGGMGAGPNTADQGSSWDRR